MKIKGHRITLKELFSLNMKNHNSLIGGFMGFAHAGISSAVLLLAWYFGLLKKSGMNPVVLMVLLWLATNLWWLKKETKGFKVSLFKPRSTPLVTRDTRMDFFNPLFWSSLIVVVFIFKVS